MDRFCLVSCATKGDEKNTAKRLVRAATLGCPGFLAGFHEAFGSSLPALPKRRGRRSRVPLAHRLPMLVFHVMNAAGSLPQHGRRLFDDALTDNARSGRTRPPIRVPVVRQRRAGSRIVRVLVRQKGQPRVITAWLERREIRGRAARPYCRLAAPVDRVLVSISQNTTPAMAARMANQPQSGIPVTSGNRNLPSAATF